MKLKFKIQPYQSAAVASVVDCFAGQGQHDLFSYRIDPGADKRNGQVQPRNIELDGFRNPELQLSPEQLLQNITDVQKRQNLPLSTELVSSPACKLNLDVEMETGTGKTYCYIKTIFELHKAHGWSKFIIVVPSVAIREGVYKSLQITADHFLETYGKKARSFIYDSKQPYDLETFSSDSGISVMVINIQAFNAKGSDARRIYGTLKKRPDGKEELVGLDDFQSRKPIDVISANRPILILDEPQKMEGKKTLASLVDFNPLMILRYSATHKTTHNKVHRLDALDAYNAKLVKKIQVRGISVKGLTGSNAYLYLESIEVSAKSPPVARMEIEIRQQSGKIVRKVRKLGKGDDLHSKSDGLEQYKGFVISQIDANRDTVEFTNGVVLAAGEITQDITEEAVRRIQIREAIKAHLDKENDMNASHPLIGGDETDRR